MNRSRVRSRWTQAALIAAPGIVAISVVVTTFVDTAGHWATIVRPAIVVALAGIGIGLAVRIGIGRPALASAIASVVVLGLMGELAWALLGGTLVAAGVVGSLRAGGGIALPNPAAIVPACALIAASVISAIATHGVDARDFVSRRPQEGGVASTNVYIVLLDGYPRGDTLADTFGYDNSTFLAALERREFDVPTDATSDFNETGSAILSMFSGDPSVDAQGQERHREIRRRIAVAPAMAELEAAGYLMESIAPPNGHVRLGGWREWDSGNLSELEVTLLGNSVLHPLARHAVVADHRDRIVRSLEHLVELAADGARRPRIVFAHVLMPHPPFLYNDRGALQAAPVCWPAECLLYSVATDRLAMDLEAYREAMQRQVRWSNDRILATVDRLVAEDADAAIILLSDHGSRYSRDDREEQGRTFFAARTPGAPGLLRDDAGPADLVRRILAAYASASAP